MRFWRAALGVGATAAVVLSMAGAASAEHNLVELTPVDNWPDTAMSRDGSHVVWSSSAQEVPADNDSLYDIYDWHHGITELASVDENGQNSAGGQYVFSGLSPDGKHIIMDGTFDQLTSEDTDGRLDVYERFAGTTRLVSQGPLNPTTQFHAYAAGMSPDGSRQFFRTATQLTPDDADACEDRYERAGGVTTLVYMYDPGCEDAAIYTFFEAPLGDRYIFATSAAVDPADTDLSRDLYEKYNGAVRILSDGVGPDAEEPVGETVGGFSDLGERVFFLTYENLTPDDTDSGCSTADPARGCRDLYEAYNGTVRLVSTGPAAGTTPHRDYDVGSASQFGGHYFFRTMERLTFDDNESTVSLYDYANGVTSYVGALNTSGSFQRASSDGSRVFFTTTANLVAQDTNNDFDVYERFAGTTTMVQPGATNGTSWYGMSKSADRVFFTTDDALVPSDTCCRDLYERFNGNYYRVMPAASPPYAVDVSDDGKYLLVETNDALSTADTDGAVDYYRISIAPSTYARPKGATPINVQFVPAYEPCGSPNRAHAAPLSFGSCNPPAQTSQYLTVGTADSNGQPTKLVGDLRLVALLDNPSTSPDDTDARYEVHVADVRNTSDLTDYTGALRLDAALQITDKNSPDPGGGSPNATGTQIGFPVTVPCTPTADTTVGSDCDIVTTANTIAPGAAVDGKRAIWETGPVQVRDGGADGNPATADGDSLFLVQGVFIP